MTATGASSEDRQGEGGGGGGRFILRWRGSDGTWRSLTESEFALDPVRAHLPMRGRTYDECARWRAHALLPADLDIVAMDN